MVKILRIASRKSPLALRQTEIFAQKLKQYWPNLNIEIIAMTTKGDELLTQKLLNWGGKGLFVKELEEALLEKRADIAVHSMKDMPAKLPHGLEIACITKRDNPFDALIGSALHQLPLGAKIGTSSLRRQAQLLAARPDLQIASLRGNIHTRLNKLAGGEYDALVLATAGLERMQFTELNYQVLDKKLMLPACGQGAIGVEARSDDHAVLQLLTKLHDQNTGLCVAVERRINQRLGGHCHVPIAIFAEIHNPLQLEIEAKVFSSDGLHVISDERMGPIDHAMTLAEECAATLIKQGALKLIGAP